MSGAAQAVSLPGRDALAKILDDNSIELHAEEYGTGMFFSMDPAEIADAVLAALSTQLAGTVEYMLRVPGETPSGPVRATREEILEDKEYVEARWGAREAVQRTIGVWTEVQS